MLRDFYQLILLFLIKNGKNIAWLVLADWENEPIVLSGSMVMIVHCFFFFILWAHYFVFELLAWSCHVGQYSIHSLFLGCFQLILTCLP